MGNIDLITEKVKWLDTVHTIERSEKKLLKGILNDLGSEAYTEMFYKHLEDSQSCYK